MLTKKISILIALYSIFGQVNAQQYLSGYAKTIKGETIDYHAPQPDAKQALLVRSQESSKYIEWQSQKVPIDCKEKSLSFLMLAAIDVNQKDPSTWNISINGENHFKISSPTISDVKTLSWQGVGGSKLTFNVQSVDRHGDLLGYLLLDVPSKNYIGKELTIRVTGESKNSLTWFMIFQYKTETKIKLELEPAIVKGTKGNSQVMRLDITHFAKPENLSIAIGSALVTKLLDYGLNQFYLEVPISAAEKGERVTLKISNQLVKDTTIKFNPIEPKTIYLLHHSHVDIGYTHIQKEVEELQWSFIESAIELAKLSKNLPNESKFKWNVEVMWAVDSYLKQATPEKRKAFGDAVKQGDIELAALYANELTGLCSSRELIELTESARRIAKECGVAIESAMITDIPGWTWGIVPVLANRGVKYLSLGTNQMHRIGDILDKWGDKPFYWVSQSGQEKLLCWIHKLGYSEFHSGHGYLNLDKVLKEEKIFNYLKSSNKTDYPYDLYVIRYNIGTDNGPTDKTLSKTVKEWNEKYVSPKLVISTTAKAFKDFEDKYGSQIPSVRGDLTGYWEDGAASSAKETSANRASANRLTQAEVLFGLLNPTIYNRDEFAKAWQKVLLYNEHTWGSWNSISEPEIEFTKQQWDVKQSFAADADIETKHLLNIILATRTNEKSINCVEVFNSLSWKRNGLVFLPSVENANSVEDAEGKVYPLQKLTDGQLVFFAEDIPPFGSKIYTLKNEIVSAEITKSYNDFKLSNASIVIELEKESGAIKKLLYKGINYVDTTSLKGLNEFFYVAGRNSQIRYGVDNIKVTQKENGPVVNSIIVESEAPGCIGLSREIQLINPMGTVKIVNKVNKERVYNQEGLHFAFPFNVPKGQVRYDLAFSQVRAEHDQLPGACKNYITMENFVDVSNNSHGITLTSIDAPLFEIGDITTDPTVYGWIENLEPSQTIYSYIMNNYWETNYRAYQEGEVTFTYVLRPHSRFNPLEAEKFGVEQNQGLIPILGSNKPYSASFELKDNGIIAVGLKPTKDGILLTLYNPSGKPEELMWVKPPQKAFVTNFDGEKISPLNQKQIIPAFGVLGLLISY